MMIVEVAALAKVYRFEGRLCKFFITEIVGVASVVNMNKFKLGYRINPKVMSIPATNITLC